MVSSPEIILSSTKCIADIDAMLTDCAVVTPVEAPNMEIDINSDDDEEFRPMRVSSKGRSM